MSLLDFRSVKIKSESKTCDDCFINQKMKSPMTRSCRDILSITTITDTERKRYYYSKSYSNPEKTLYAKMRHKGKNSAFIYRYCITLNDSDLQSNVCINSRTHLIYHQL